MKYRYIYILLWMALMAAFIPALFSQPRTVIAGLESDSLYMALIEEEGLLRSKEDSLSGTVARTRSLFRTDPDNRQVYSEDILRLEAEIFDTRNRIGITAGKINNIEQQYIIRNLTGGGDPQGAAERTEGKQYEETGANLVFNPFFADNLPPDDYATLIEAQEKEQPVAGAIESFAKNYALIKQLAAELEAADNAPEADSIYARYETIARLNENYSQSVKQDFGFVYENKLYCYNYILDKLGLYTELSSFEKKITQTRDRTIAAGGAAESADIAAYPHRKALLFDYEMTLARLAGYPGSLDSLSKAENTFTKVSFDFPAIEVQQKLFLDYSTVEFFTPARYNNSNPVPPVEIHPKGEIYRILLGNFQRAQPVSVLKGAYPVGVLQQEGRFLYYAGGYATLEEAAGAVEQLKGKGFRDPKIARWTDGRYKLFEAGEVDRLLGKVNAGLFRLAIDTEGKPLPDVVREILEDLSPAAEISRSGDLYIISTFDSRSLAQEIMDEILDETEGLDVKIEDVG